MKTLIEILARFNVAVDKVSEKVCARMKEIRGDE